MGIERIKKAVENILNRISVVEGKGEEATKQAMVLPMIEALGYDIWNPSQVCPEFEADTAVKKNGQKEKVDYAILLNDIPRIFVEVKPYGENLEGHHGQLKRYFSSTPSVSLGALTNGVEYRFFTDTGELNIQDDHPFFTAKLDAIDQGLDVLARFQKEVFSADAIREFATELTYTSKIYNFLSNEIDIRENDLSENFIRWILSAPDMYEGRVTSNVVERFLPISKNALQRVVQNIVRRSVAAIDEGIKQPHCEIVEENKNSEEPSEEITGELDCRKGIETTDEELECFAIVKQQFESCSLANVTIYDPASRQEMTIEIGYKDTSSYFNIYFNKPSWWNLRISLDSRVKWVGIDIDCEKGKELLPQGFNLLEQTSLAQFRVQIQGPQDLHTLNQLIFASFEKTIKDRKEYAELHNNS